MGNSDGKYKNKLKTYWPRLGVRAKSYSEIKIVKPIQKFLYAKVSL